MIGKDKQADLRLLEKCVQFPHIHRDSLASVVRTMWPIYPVQFVQYMRQHRAIKEDPSTGDVADEAYPCALNLVNVLYCRLQGYLLQPLQSAAQQKDLSKIVIKLEDLLLRQNLEN